MSELEIFPWNENFESGIPLIDEQHKKLVSLLNHLVQQIAIQSASVQLDAIFHEITDYVDFHFRAEEGIWKDHFEGDVWEKWHLQSHSDFVVEINKIQQAGADRPYDETLLSVVRFLTHWLARHILDSDKRMAKVVLALPSGISLARAKEAANEEMAGSTRLLIDTLMTMYDKLADSTVQMSREIQRRKMAEDELRRSKQVLEAASRAKSAFLANMSHELRTPLNTILGYSDILRRDPQLSGEQRETLDIVHRSGAHLLNVINDVLELTKIETGHVQVDLQPFNIAATVVEVVEMLSLRAQERNVRLEVKPDPGFAHYIVSDEAKIRQILINLTSNAIKATRAGVVTLALALQPERPERLRLTVSDTGVGIDAADQQRIFEPFEQIKSQSDWQGTGLGLAICRQFVDLMGGRIALHSQVGVGSSFCVELPVTLAQPEQIAPVASGRGEVVGIAPGQQLGRILVVEDNLENQSLLAHILRRVGFDVIVADNGVQALERFQDQQPVFVWMDRRMPLMDGLEATRRIRLLPHGQQVKIAAVTASSLREDDAELRSSGFDAVVHKPFAPEHIYDCMERLLGLELIRATPAQTHSSLPVIEPAALAALPAALRQELSAALLLLDQQRILDVIARIAQVDATLAAALQEGVTHYHYLHISRQLQAPHD